MYTPTHPLPREKGDFLFLPLNALAKVSWALSASALSPSAGQLHVNALRGESVPSSSMTPEPPLKGAVLLIGLDWGVYV